MLTHVGGGRHHSDPARALAEERSTDPGAVVTRSRVVILAALALALVVALVVGAVVVVSHADDDGVSVSASSSARGTDAAGLLDASTDAGDARWASAGDGHGASLTVDFDRSESVDRILIVGGRDRSFHGAIAVLDGGEAVALTADERRQATSVFSRRRVSSVQVYFTAGSSPGDPVGIRALRVDDSGSPPSDGVFHPTPSASSSTAEAGALIDGDPTTGAARRSWTAATADRRPRVTERWGSSRLVSAVQILGPSSGGSEVDPTRDRLSGELRFSDGSTVAVPSIEVGATVPTTIAFAARAVDAVTLSLARASDSRAPFALREFRVYPSDVTPPRWPTLARHVVDAAPDDASCSAVPPSAIPTESRLLCPTVGATVGSRVTVAIAARPGTVFDIEGSSSLGGRVSGPSGVLATLRADDEGLARGDVTTSGLGEGPVVLNAVPRDGGTDVPVQFFHDAGTRVTSPGFAPDGMTLEWDERFQSGVSVTKNGQGADYAAQKPEWWGGTQFGDADFADPSSAGNLQSVDDYLRMRIAPQDAGPGRQAHTGALLSSARIGGGGFGAQYGYFEARMKGGPGIGTWPAFWLLDMQSAVTEPGSSTEVDAVELYGHDVSGSCHSTHHYTGRTQDSGTVRCTDPDDDQDWTSQWHTYGVRVLPGTAVFTIDGRQVVKLDDLQDDDRPFFFLLDLALGGGWPTDLSPAGGRSDLYVDWVHVYT